MTAETFSAMATHMTNISAKFHWKSSTEYRDITSRGIGVNGQRTDDPKTFRRPLLAAEANKTKTKSDQQKKKNSQKVRH